MGFNRGLIQSPGVPTPALSGSGILANVSIDAPATDANVTITTAMMQRGGVQFTGFTAGRNITTPTGAQITAAFPEMDVGDGFIFIISIQTAFAGTYVAGDANVTLSGRATTPASSFSIIAITRLPDSAGVRQYRWRVL